ncbi:Tyrosine--tRNA ligase [Candidatus Westeberhardia cardiocondylae]|uniref:Tyrosine--tRNA ligase n=1 Tax=Candidatus Westeberhardia cardiocondylae TaxID=1594731 RepID=A0A0H5BX83_9ENTR|nr:tyrosine--tRNA ligase [Candidatus Westeberhardia cardiocondylae]CEN32249.1 Tyrosine--tRNA ligase [Candidatus Westeberhardia cardiocondylae]
MSNLIQQFEERELVSQIIKQENLVKLLKEKSITVYCGFDPSNDSLHVGNLLLLICLRRFQLAGHRPLILLGGATGLVGDPSFRKKERKLYSLKKIKNWTKKIKKQVSLFLDFNCGENSAIIVNNYDWFKNMSILNFLRNIGKYFSVNHMINKEAIKKRLNRNNYGITFTEFSYSLFQGYDFVFLNNKYNAILQIGGSDQWGNIISGIDLIRKLNGNVAYGLTVPLITKVDGTKFSKSETNETIWLDPIKTNSYNFYQFWINVSDKDVFHFLKIFTFLDLSDIQILKDRMKQKIFSKKKFFHREAQYILAKFLTKLVHGKRGLLSAQCITEILFSENKIQNLTENDFKKCVKNGISMIVLQKIQSISLQQALIMTKLVLSGRQAKDIILANAISINGKKQNNKKYIITDDDIKYGHYTLLCRGKKNHRLIYWK